MSFCSAQGPERQAPFSSPALHLRLGTKGPGHTAHPHKTLRCGLSHRSCCMCPRTTLLFFCRFGKYSHDELSILAPLQQCCRYGVHPTQPGSWPVTVTIAAAETTSLPTPPCHGTERGKAFMP